MKDIMIFDENDPDEIRFDGPDQETFAEQIRVVFEFFEHLFEEAEDYDCEPRSAWFDNFRTWVINHGYSNELMSKDEMEFYEAHAKEFQLDLFFVAV